MALNVDQQKQRLMQDGYVILRQMIWPDELEPLRASVNDIVKKSEVSSGRVTMTDWVDNQTGDVVEFCFDDRIFDFSRQLMAVPDAAPLGMWVLCSSSTGWHRDIHPIDMAPLDGLQEDIKENGPPYVQWNIALYDDNYLHVIPKSHLRRSSKAENKVERRFGVVPLPNAIPVDLKAGDGVVYINSILHSATGNGNNIRRTLHLGYQAFGGRGFTHFFLPSTMGVHFVKPLKSWAAERCHYFEQLHAKRHDDVAFTLRAILEKDERGFREGLIRIHRSEHARITTLIVLSKIAYLTRKYKGSKAKDSANGPCIQGMADRFTTSELEQLWCRFAVLDSKLQSDVEQYEPLFQSGPMKYFFNEMPKGFDVNNFISSWDG